jgi:hypothetical protein
MNTSKIRQFIYILLAIGGFVFTTYYLLRFIELTEGSVSFTNFMKFDWILFFKSGFANPAAGFITVDVITGAIAYLVWMVPEARSLKMKHWWIYLVLVFAVSFAFSFPVFLFMRERKLNTIEQTSDTAQKNVAHEC